jgi:hypothetical protein
VQWRGTHGTIPVDDSACSRSWWSNASIHLCQYRSHIERTHLHRWTHARPVDSGGPGAPSPRSIVSSDDSSPTLRGVSRPWTAGRKSISMPSLPSKVYRLEPPTARLRAYFLVVVFSVSLLRVRSRSRRALHRPFLGLLPRRLHCLVPLLLTDPRPSTLRSLRVRSPCRSATSSVPTTKTTTSEESSWNDISGMWLDVVLCRRRVARRCLVDLPSAGWYCHYRPGDGNWRTKSSCTSGFIELSMCGHTPTFDTDTKCVEYGQSFRPSTTGPRKASSRVFSS